MTRHTKAQMAQTLQQLQFSVSTMEWNADMSDHVIMLLTQAGYPVITLPEGYRVNIEVDSFYEPDGDYDLEQERASLAAGELTAYAVLLEKVCECGSWNVVQSLSGVVVETSNADNLYDSLDNIPDQYLLQTAAELIIEEQS